MMNSFNRDKMLPLKALCALVIVATHLAGNVECLWLKLFIPLGMFAVSLFLFISGYGLARSYMKKGDTYLSGFFCKRIWKVLWPAIVALILWYLLIRDPNRNFLHDLYRTFRWGSPPLPQFWYVLEIICLYLLFWISFRIVPEKWRLPVLWLCALLFMVLTIALGYDRNWWIHTLAFPTGASYAYGEERLLKWLNKHYLNPLFSLIVLLFLFVVFYRINIPYLWTLCYVFVSLAGALAVSWIPLEKIHNPFIRFTGTVSYEIYLFHGIAIAALRGNRIFITSDGWYIAAVYLVTLAMAGLFLLAKQIQRFWKKPSTT